MTITKEELVSLIKETVASMNSEQKTDTQEMKNAECACDPTTDEKVENGCGKEADVAKNGEVIEDEVKDDVKEEGKTKEEVQREIKEEVAEEKADKEDDKEVIRIEALNSRPMAFKDVSGKDNWDHLHGRAFWDYLAKHPEITR